MYSFGCGPVGGPVEGAPVLEPIEHSVLEKSLDDGLHERMLVREPLEHSVPAITWIDGPLEGTPVLEPLEHSVLEKSSHVEPMEEAPVLEPLEHSILKKPLAGGSLKGISVVDWFVRLFMEPLEHSVLATTSMWEPLEHSNWTSILSRWREFNLTCIISAPSFHLELGMKCSEKRSFERRNLDIRSGSKI